MLTMESRSMSRHVPIGPVIFENLHLFRVVFHLLIAWVPHASVIVTSLDAMLCFCISGSASKNS